jgi:hypothetical protein
MEILNVYCKFECSKLFTEDLGFSVKKINQTYNILKYNIENKIYTVLYLDFLSNVEIKKYYFSKKKFFNWTKKNMSSNQYLSSSLERNLDKLNDFLNEEEKKETKACCVCNKTKNGKKKK